MLSERLLRKWRIEALKAILEKSTITVYDGSSTLLPTSYLDAQERIIKLTGELLDQHLLRKE